MERYLVHGSRMYSVSIGSGVASLAHTSNGLRYLKKNTSLFFYSNFLKLGPMQLVCENFYVKNMLFCSQNRNIIYISNSHLF
jgi:hypothetical protein